MSINAKIDAFCNHGAKTSWFSGFIALSYGGPNIKYTV
jgi:hypothetical protein